MLWVYKDDRSNAFSCHTDAELFRHISLIENSKLLPGHPQFGESSWSFTCYTPARVSEIYARTFVHLRTPALKQAYEGNTGLAEIYRGDIQKPLEIVLTDDINVNALKKQWCLEYCKAYDYIIVEQQLPLTPPQSQPTSGCTQSFRDSQTCIDNGAVNHNINGPLGHC